MSKGLAFHEDAAAFGPCVGPMSDPEGDVSWACAGFGTERIDPERWDLSEIIICGRCFSLREGRVIQQSVESMMEASA